MFSLSHQRDDDDEIVNEFMVERHELVRYITRKEKQ